MQVKTHQYQRTLLLLAYKDLVLSWAEEQKIVMQTCWDIDRNQSKISLSNKSHFSLSNKSHFMCRFGLLGWCIGEVKKELNRDQQDSWANRRQHHKLSTALRCWHKILHLNLYNSMNICIKSRKVEMHENGGRIGTCSRHALMWCGSLLNRIGCKVVDA